jgi:putative aldouronate transport system permease protein
MMIPGALYLLINNYLPMLGLIVAFKQMDFRVGLLASKWVGFQNFMFLFRSNDAWIITRNTILYNLAFIVLNTLVPCVIAILLNEVRANLAKRFYQTVILVPYLISIVVVSYVVYGFLNTDAGYVNNTLLPMLGIDRIAWYSQPKYWPLILVAVYVWKNFGYSSILYFATLSGIDCCLYEAAYIDGANRWKRIWHITLPGLKTTIVMLNMIAIGKIFYSDFGLFYQVPMNSGLLFDVTNTIDTYVYRSLLQFNDIGLSSAAGFYQSVVGFVLVIAANHIVKKIDTESAAF